MAEYTFSLPEPMNHYLNQQIHSGQYATISEYIGELIRKDQRSQSAAIELKNLLDEAEASGISNESMSEIRANARIKAGL